MYKRLLIVPLSACHDDALGLIRLRAPDALLLVVAQNLQRWEGALRARLPAIECIPVEVSPYDVDAIRRTLQTTLRKHPAQEIEAGLGSGPWAVRLALMQLARSCQWRTPFAVEHTRPRRVDDVLEAHPPLDIDLASYFAQREIEMGKCSQERKPRYRQASRHLVEHLDTWRSVLAWLRGADIQNIRLKSQLSFARGDLQAQHLDLLFALRANGLLGSVSARGSEIAYSLNNENQRAFLNGKWLELFVYETLKDLFEDARWGQDFKTHQQPDPSRFPRDIELDFIGLRHHRLLVASCKTGQKPFKVQHLEELREACRLLQTPACIRLFVTHHRRETETDFDAYARRHAICVIEGGTLHALRDAALRLMARAEENAMGQIVF